jgi:hypothetical protein
VSDSLAANRHYKIVINHCANYIDFLPDEETKESCCPLISIAIAKFTRHNHGGATRESKQLWLYEISQKRRAREK